MMTTNVSLLTVCFLAATTASSQTIHRLQPYTGGNRIELTITNGSPAESADQVEVKAVQYPQAITFANAVHAVETVPPRGRRTVRFTFDVGRPSTANDTLKFVITEGSGAVWEKYILVRYALPMTYALEQNFPNPFNPTTTIRYRIPTGGKVRLKVYDVLGREVMSLVDEEKAAGYYEAVLDASQLASGVYFYRMYAGNYTAVRKLLVIK